MDSTEGGAAQGLILYGTSACHLCDVAEDLLGYYRDNIYQIHYQKSDISESDDLFQRYGTRIPVLQRADGEELDWPFSARELGWFLGS